MTVFCHVIFVAYSVLVIYFCLYDVVKPLPFTIFETAVIVFVIFYVWEKVAGLVQVWTYNTAGPEVYVLERLVLF